MVSGGPPVIVFRRSLQYLLLILVLLFLLLPVKAALTPLEAAAVCALFPRVTVYTDVEDVFATSA